MKNYVKWVLPILLTGIFVLSACQPAIQAVDSEPSPEAVQPVQGIPAIDQNQPDEFATATFSLG